jgi:hypothetical protein
LWHRGHPQKQHTAYNTGKLPSVTLTFTADLTAHCATSRTTNTTTPSSTLGPTSRLLHSMTSFYAEVPQFMGSLNTCTICTHNVAVLATSSPIIQYYADIAGDWNRSNSFPLSHTAPRHIRTAQVITQPQKLHSQLLGLVTAVT